MLPEQTNSTANKLARGPVTTQSIEAVRRDLVSAERRISHDQRLAAARRERDAARRQQSASSPAHVT